MSQHKSTKAVELKTYKGNPDHRGYANLLIEYGNENKIKVSIPYCSKVKEVFTLFPPEAKIDWFTHTLQIQDTKLWYDDEIYKYKDLLKRKTVVQVVPDEEEPFISIVAYYLGVFLEKILTKIFPNLNTKN